MAYDLADYRLDFRFYIGDPNGYTFTNNEVRDNYINPAYREWMRRFERRPGNAVANSMAAGTGLTVLDNTGNIIEHLTLLTGTDEEGLKRDEFNRLRYLQETEGATRRPESWATIKLTDFYTYAIFYPIPDTTYDFKQYSQPLLTLLTTDSTMMRVDPVTAHMIVRLAAYRAGLDMHLSARKLKAIIMPVAGWIRMRFNMEHLFEDKPFPKEGSLGFPKERVQA